MAKGRRADGNAGAAGEGTEGGPSGNTNGDDDPPPPQVIPLGGG